MGKKRKNNADSRKRAKEILDPYPYSDGYFAFIAGCTSGGAPFGVTWEELGIDPDLSMEEKHRLWDEQNGITPYRHSHSGNAEDPDEDPELPF